MLLGVENRPTWDKILKLIANSKGTKVLNIYLGYYYRINTPKTLRDYNVFIAQISFVY
jgi:hypothetical protein